MRGTVIEEIRVWTQNFNSRAPRATTTKFSCSHYDHTYICMTHTYHDHPHLPSSTRQERFCVNSESTTDRMMRISDVNLSELVNAASQGMNEAVYQTASDIFRNLDPKHLKNDDIENLRRLVESVTTYDAIPPLTATLNQAILRYPPNTLTPFHSFLVRHCCATRSYSDSLPILQHAIHFVQPESGLTYHDHLSYHFYSGLCYIALKRFDKALDALSLAIGARGHNTSLIQVEAYKKYILVGLIEHGDVVALPQTTSGDTRRSLEILANKYSLFAKKYSENPEGLAKFTQANRQVFINDGNMQLIRSAIASIASHKIKKLRDVYTSMSIGWLADKLSLKPDKARSAIEDMVSDNRIVAHIDEDDFVNFPVDNNSVGEQVAKLNDTSICVQTLKNQMKSMQNTLELDPAYLKSNMTDLNKKVKDKMDSQSLVGTTQDVDMIDDEVDAQSDIKA